MGPNIFPVCVHNLTILPNISKFSPFRFGCIAYMFIKITNNHCVNFILIHKEIHKVRIFSKILRFLHIIWLLIFNPKIQRFDNVQLSIITNI